LHANEFDAVGIAIALCGGAVSTGIDGLGHGPDAIAKEAITDLSERRVCQRWQHN